VVALLDAAVTFRPKLITKIRYKSLF
jgi:hypothetical protein